MEMVGGSAVVLDARGWAAGIGVFVPCLLVLVVSCHLTMGCAVGPRSRSALEILEMLEMLEMPRFLASPTEYSVDNGWQAIVIVRNRAGSRLSIPLQSFVGDPLVLSLLQLVPSSVGRVCSLAVLAAAYLRENVDLESRGPFWPFGAP